MARRKSSPRRRARRWSLYLLATVLLAGLVGALWYWWDMRSWAPDEATYPDQGVMISGGQGLVAFETLHALGARFAYLEASSGVAGKAPRFARNLAAARRAGVQAGAVHLFDPCTGADPQSANFVTVVPRDAQLLPPVIAILRTARECDPHVSDAAVESELMTFINQVELHAGRRAILKLSPAVEGQYRLAELVDRDIWLVRDRFRPRYAERPWLLWSANGARVTEASDEPLEWIVVQP